MRFVLAEVGLFMGKIHQICKNKALLPWFIWGLAASYFFLDYLARVSPGVMGRELQLAFGVNATTLGLLTSFFYYPYILMQLPVGLIVDRYSIRYLLTVMSILTAVGCSVFGLAESIYVAALARMIIGFSAAFAMVSALRLAATWFPPERLGLLAGLTQALGMWGAAFGEMPVSFLMDQVGWRNTMVLMASVFVLLAGLILKFVQDSPKNQSHQIGKASLNTQALKIRESLKTVLCNRQAWVMAIYAGLLFAPSAVIAEFWGPSYLQYGRGLSAHSAAFANGLIFIGWGIGGPIAGWISDRIGLRKPLCYVSALCGLCLLSIIFFWPQLSNVSIYLLFFLYGLTNISVVIAYAAAAEITPRHCIGTTLAFANMGSILIGAVLQPIFGYVLEVSTGKTINDIALLTRTDFSTALSLLPLCSLLAFLCVFLMKETYCTPLHSKSS